MKHLTDEEIQAYLQGEAVAEKARVENHLNECSACRRVLEEYANLYDALAREECFGPSLELATRTLHRLRIARRDKSLREYLDTFVGLLGIAIAVAVAAWAYVALGGPRPDFGEVSNAVAKHFSPALESLAYLRSTLPPVHVEIGFAVIAGFVIYVILSLDYLLFDSPAGQKVTR